MNSKKKTLFLITYKLKRHLFRHDLSRSTVFSIELHMSYSYLTWCTGLIRYLIRFSCTLGVKFNLYGIYTPVCINRKFYLLTRIIGVYGYIALWEYKYLTIISTFYLKSYFTIMYFSVFQITLTPLQIQPNVCFVISRLFTKNYQIYSVQKHRTSNIVLYSFNSARFKISKILWLV